MEPEERNPRKVILHLAAEFPNVFRRNNTLAVKHLIEGSKNFDHVVVALRRTVQPWKVDYHYGEEEAFPILAFRYWAPPWGFFLRSTLYCTANAIAKQLKKECLHVDIIHAHKLTREGVIAGYLSQILGVPFMLSIRGESESKVYRFKPYLIPYFNRLIEKSRHVFYVSAWFKPTINDKKPHPEDKQTLLPNFVRHIPEASEVIQPFMIAILDLNVYKKKGLDKLIAAFELFSEIYPEVTLEVYGGGSQSSIEQVKSLIRAANMEDRIHLNGRLENSQLMQRLAESSAMVLPSHNESFGMVYVEALLASVPILYSRRTGIDGFIDGIPAAEGVDPTDISSIAVGLKHLWECRVEYKQWLIEHKEQIKSRFDKEIHIERYESIVGTILKTPVMAEEG